MPTYEYECTNEKCGHAFELFQSMTDAVKRKCPQCAKPKLRRLIGTGAGIIFKGSGFYQTDYRSDSYRKAAEADKPAPAGGEGKKKGDDQKKESTTSEPKASSNGANCPSCDCGGKN